MTSEGGSLIAGKRHPYIRARCGEGNPYYAETKPHRRGHGSPSWQAGEPLVLPRHAQDKGILVVELLTFSKRAPDRFVSGNHISLTACCDNEPGEEIKGEIPLHANGRPQGGHSTGAKLHYKIKWDPSMKVEGQNEVGRILFTPVRAEGVIFHDEGIRDLSEFRDAKMIRVTLLLLFAYLMIGFFFYHFYMRSDEGVGGMLQQRIQGGNGDWSSLNTWVFIVTSFTTVGYGNQPSMVRTSPPCEYVGKQLQVDNPYSELLPASLRGDQMINIGRSTLFDSVQVRIVAIEIERSSLRVSNRFQQGVAETNANSHLPNIMTSCFDTPAHQLQQPECWVIADDFFACEASMCYFICK